MNAYDLTEYAAFLAKERDLAQSLFDEFGDRDDRGRARAYRMALDRLWFATNGEFGQRFDEQPGGTR
jgi:hypothetical protein